MAACPNCRYNNTPNKVNCAQCHSSMTRKPNPDAPANPPAVKKGKAITAAPATSKLKASDGGKQPPATDAPAAGGEK